MELTIDKKESSNSVNWLSLIAQAIKPIHTSEISNLNRESLKELISYMSQLNKSNVIDDKQFKDVLILICSRYMENEVELRVSNKINEKIFHFFEKS